MRHIRRNGLITLMATGGMLALAAGSAQADADVFDSAFDPAGLVSGDETRSAHSPAGACGDTMNTEGLLSPAAGGTCADEGERHGSHKDEHGNSHRGDEGGKNPVTGVVDSLGLSGDDLRLPVDLPGKDSSGAVSIVGTDDPAPEGGGEAQGQPVTPPKSAEAVATAEVVEPVEEAPAPTEAPALAVTGSGDLVGMGLPAAGLVLAGTLLYRRSRASATRA
ncbi:chaplin family protein [Streptomyces sp. TRM76323]|uniref:Chaplin family protein n=1 Tax=Streptomyces tamarix TaxID=3078565 RepID=A0ABU3QFB9_9ACTN|nr:chaplin family protein [Streptomyces tamarix]MDT9681438.1 chaplin family protein [Streptomyces tamarix]